MLWILVYLVCAFVSLWLHQRRTPTLVYDDTEVVDGWAADPTELFADGLWFMLSAVGILIQFWIMLYDRIRSSPGNRRPSSE